MNDYKLPIIEPTIDYSKVPPINQKRTISFINHFIIHTVTFLNKFALSCEEKLFEFENKLQRVEASLEILESSLSSVPGLEQEPQQSKVTQENVETKLEESVDTSLSKVEETSNMEVLGGPKTEEQSPSKDPRYEKYFKLIHFGAKKSAVKLTMEQEGLDSSVLDEQPQVGKGKSADNAERTGN